MSAVSVCAYLLCWRPSLWADSQHLSSPEARQDTSSLQTSGLKDRNRSLKKPEMFAACKHTQSNTKMKICTKIILCKTMNSYSVSMDAPECICLSERDLHIYPLQYSQTPPSEQGVWARGREPSDCKGNRMEAPSSSHWCSPTPESATTTTCLMLCTVFKQHANKTTCVNI